MKASLISMIIVLCVLAIIPMVLMNEGSFVARLGLGLFPGAEQAPQPPKNLTTVTTDKKVQVYKWRDEDGIMQFANVPPPEAKNVEVVELTPNTNHQSLITT